MSAKDVIIINPPPPPDGDGLRAVPKKVRYASITVEVDDGATPEQIALAYERGKHALVRLNE